MPRTDKSIRTESRSVVAQNWGGACGVITKGYRVSFRVGIGSTIHGGVGSTTLL